MESVPSVVPFILDLHNGFLSTFFFAEKQTETADADLILESGCQSQFQDRAMNVVFVRGPFRRLRLKNETA